MNGLKVGAKYVTKSENIVKCVAKLDDYNICRYTKVIDGHESLMDKAENWGENGKWLQFPGGIHDIVKKLP